MKDEMADVWDSFCDKIDEFRKSIGQNKAVHVNIKSLREQGKTLVQSYFREARPDIVTQMKNETILSDLDQHMQNLLDLTQHRTEKALYKNILKLSRDCIQKISIQRELEISKALSGQIDERNAGFSNLEKSILNILEQLLPSAALSYQQALLDLNSSQRISFKGTANELREALRETLDHLATDTEVMKQEGFTLEKGRTKPTTKQKVRFILKARGLSRKASKASEESVDIIEERFPSLVRATYDRSSISTHINSTRSEVLQLKEYVNAVLAELLLIHATDKVEDIIA